MSDFQFNSDVILLAILLILSGLISGSEVALFSLSKTDIKSNSDLNAFKIVDNLLKEPNSFKVDKHEVSIMYAVCGALAARASVETCPNICKIADKMDPEFQIILMRDALHREVQFKFQPDFKNWAAKNATVIL